MPLEKTAHTTTRVQVRMYRQGLGDCFLLTFPREGSEPFRMLIDCGVVLGTSNPTDIMGKVVANIASATGNHLDLLVVTHEHWDHLSGFNQAQTLFDAIHIDSVWFAWTEDPADPLAKKLRAERRTAEDALRMAAVHLNMAGDSETAGRVAGLVSFFGAASGSTGDALDYVKKRAGKPKYRKPGEPPIALDALPGVRFWVLGPPHDEKLIKKSNPSQGAAYGLDAADGGSQSFFVKGVAAAMGAGGDGLLQDDGAVNPFDELYSIPLDRARNLPFFSRRYFGESTDGSLHEKLSGHGVAEMRDQSWRRIDADWLGLSETMALQLDSATNNTSLVLAIELTDTGEVLLFPGDAQAGNWMSWQSLKWDADPKAGLKAVTGPELLARTTFYKVGHHGSHNATLKALGLELMTSTGLVAFIPVNQAMAKKKGWGQMPLPDLVSRIAEKTEGRVLRIDDAIESDADLAAKRPAKMSDEDWRQFTSRVKVDPLYYEISL